MIYSDFSLAKVRDYFELTLDESKDLFASVAPIASSETLTLILADYNSVSDCDHHRKSPLRVLDRSPPSRSKATAR